MAKVHVTRKELKKDALQEAGLTFLEYWETHWKKIITIALIVVAVYAAIRIGAAVMANNRAKASAMLVQAQQKVQSAALTGDAQQQDQMLKSAISEAEQLQSKYGSGGPGVEALYIKGNALFQKQEYDQAIGVYKNYIGQAKTDADRAKGNIAIAYAYENKYFLSPKSEDFFKQAMSSYEKARDLAKNEEGKPTYLAYQAMLGMGRLYEAKGDTAKAIDLYKTVMNDRALAAELKPAKNEEGKEIDPEDREARLKEIRNEIRRIQAQFSFEEMAQANLDELGVSTDEATTQTKTK